MRSRYYYIFGGAFTLGGLVLLALYLTTVFFVVLFIAMGFFSTKR